MTKTFKIITNALIGVLAFFFILFTGMGIMEFADGISVYTRDEDFFLYALEDGRYGDMVASYHQNMALEAKTTDTMEECYAIARYYEAAIDYKIAALENDTKQMKKTKNLMEESSKEMGTLSYAQNEIDKLLDF